MTDAVPALTDDMQKIIRESLDFVNQDARGNLYILFRERLYKHFARFSPISTASSLWLSFVATEHTIAKLTSETDKNGASNAFSPLTALQVVSDVVHSKLGLEDQKIKQVGRLLYHANGNFWGNSDEDFPWNAHLASAALYSTYSILQGHDPFKPFRCKVQDQQGIVTDTLCLEKDFTDDDIEEPTLGILDAPSWAARAYAWSGEPFDNHPDYIANKRQAFWVWWLTEGTIRAWKIANSYAIKKA